MMRFLHVAVAVVSFLSAGQSAPLSSCDNLIKPLEINGTEKLLGKWIQVAESTDNQMLDQLLRTYRENSWMKAIATTKTDKVILSVSSKVLGECLSAAFKVHLENNTLKANVTEVTNHGGSSNQVPIITLLKTGCSDCLLLQPPQNDIRMKLGSRNAVLLSRRRSVSDAELEEFKKQSECLGLLPPSTANPNAELCPELSTADTESMTYMPRIFINGKKFDLDELFMNADSLPELEKLRKLFSDVFEKVHPPEEESNV